MDATTWTLIGLVVLLVVLVAVAVLASRRRRTHLEHVAERRAQLRIRPLPAETRERYLARWQAIQADFVDHPGEAVDAADQLVTEVMTERGYPGDDVTTRTELMAADHPEVVEQYRAAHDARRRHHEEGATATTEELRRAMVHYRELVTLLVEEDDREPRHRG